MCRVRTTGPLYETKIFNFKLCLMRRADHENGTPSIARRPRLVYLLKQYLKNSSPLASGLFAFNK